MGCYLYKVNKIVWSDVKDTYTWETYRESRCVFDEDFDTVEEAQEAIEEDAYLYDGDFHWSFDGLDYVWYDPNWNETREGGIRYSITKYNPKD